MRQLFHKIAIAMVAIVALQFAGANLGAHQLHLGTHDQEEDNHPHLQFTAQVESLQQCVDCVCEATEFEPKQHQHLVTKVETKSFDLCLDCQCHGGHLTLISQVVVVPSVPLSQGHNNLVEDYFPPEQQPAYRPPIA